VHIHKIGIVAKDIEAAVQFYTQKLGLHLIERFPVPDDEDFVFLGSGDLILELMPARTTKAPPGFHHISFAAEDLEKSVSTLRERGVEIVREPFSVGVGGIRLAFLAGPEGLDLQLFERRGGGR